jgi:hypothetical protein
MGAKRPKANAKWPRAEWQFPRDEKKKRTFEGQSQSAQIAPKRTHCRASATSSSEGKADIVFQSSRGGSIAAAALRPASAFKRLLFVGPDVGSPRYIFNNDLNKFGYFT